jgi:ABC-type sulfate/molybdate transport systems ATPase subunit
LGLTAQQQKARVEELLNVLGISELAQRKVSDLSGGQAQRVAIARTIVLQPSLLLLDEPFSALDAATRKELQQWLLDLRRKLGLTVILVTHDIDEAFELADRILVLGPLGTAPTEFAISELKIATSITKAAQPKLDQTKQLIIQKLKENK